MMGSRQVYLGLLNVFPQVDSRILRAVSIENPNDINKAVEVVLTEVIPNIASTSDSTNDTIDNASREEDIVYSASLNLNENAGLKNSSSDDTNDDGDRVCGSDGELVVLPKKSSIDNENSQSKYATSTTWDSEDVPSNLENLVESNFEQLSSNININLNQLCSNVNSLDLNAPSEEALAEAVLDTTSLASEVVLQQDNDERETEISTTAPVNNVSITEVVDCEDEAVEEKFDHGLVDFENEDEEKISTKGVDEFEDAHSNLEVSRSGQICRIDLLEEIIEDARDNKKTLFSAMESVISLMREVELREKEAEEVKEEAARGPLSILQSVEDLKEMLQHAREANDMHSGEVYGEKAILVTEAKELQSRLICLSDERDKSLTILDEMRRTLEQRLEAAEKAMKEAEEDKMEKEKSARNALAEQEQIMEKLVQESKLLKQEAEENSKLQEFLMDRGRVVDTLQGEISVIFQDIKLLKLKFDNRVPLSDSLSSSQTSCRLASSSSSIKSLHLDQMKKKTTPTPSISDHLSSGEEVEANNGDALVEDDGWEIFDKELNM